MKIIQYLSAIGLIIRKFIPFSDNTRLLFQGMQLLVILHYFLIWVIREFIPIPEQKYYELLEVKEQRMQPLHMEQ